MNGDQILPNGRDKIKMGRMQNHQLVLLGLSYEQLGSIMDAMNCSWETVTSGDQYFMKCTYEDLSFTVFLLDDDEDLVKDNVRRGSVIRCMAGFKVQVSSDVELDVPETVNRWNTDTIGSRATFVEEGVQIDTLIPLDGVLSSFMTDALFDWFERVADLIEFLKDCSAKKGDEDE